jgi:predicted MFS family arabinose efflux permease
MLCYGKEVIVASRERFGQIPAPAADHDGVMHLEKGEVFLLALSSGGMVATIYYIQPLLAAIARDFHVSEASMGAIAMLSQLGTALGMFSLVPLGDNHERRKLIVLLILANTVSLVLLASASSILWLALASFCVGMTAAVVHIIVPYTAHLSIPSERGRTVGVVLSGLLLGILLARTLSGVLGAWMGWRAIYWVAAGLCLVIGILFRIKLPASGPVTSLSWRQLIASTVTLVRTQPVLREAAILGATFFAAFSAFWTTLVFFLGKPPYHYGSAAAGLFGLVGAVGAIAAPSVGRLADRHGARKNILFALIVTLFSFLVLFVFGHSLIGLIAGVILLDVGVQAGHVSNQTRIYALVPEARSRLNMVYMVCYFTAGAGGSLAGSLLWKYCGWAGVCGFGSAVAVCGVIVYVLTGPRLASHSSNM